MSPKDSNYAKADWARTMKPTLSLSSQDENLSVPTSVPPSLPVYLTQWKQTDRINSLHCGFPSIQPEGVSGTQVDEHTNVVKISQCICLCPSPFTCSTKTIPVFLPETTLLLIQLFHYQVQHAGHKQDWNWVISHKLKPWRIRIPRLGGSKPNNTALDKRQQIWEAVEFRNRTLLITLKITYTDTSFFCHWMERSRRKKNPNRNNSIAQLQTLLATSTGNWKYKVGVKITPAWRAGSSHLGRVREALTMQHNTNTRMSMPVPALPWGREESSKEDMENKGHLQTPLL